MSMNLPSLDRIPTEAADRFEDLTLHQSSSTMRTTLAITDLYNRASAKARAADSKGASL